MKKLFAVLLAAIFGVVLYAAIEQHQEVKRQERARAEQALSECWLRVAANGGGAGAELCKSIAASLDK